jgi:hypothetical protein
VDISKFDAVITTYEMILSQNMRYTLQVRQSAVYVVGAVWFSYATPINYPSRLTKHYKTYND